MPYLTQQPVWPGERFVYSFVPPDTGTFFFHPHCNTAEQLGRGLAGVLIVEGDESEPYDAEMPIVLRDWRIDETSGEFASVLHAGRRRQGGHVRHDPQRQRRDRIRRSTCRHRGDCRLRLLNLDRTRVMELGSRGRGSGDRRDRWNRAAAGSAEERGSLGPAMRLDIVMRAPADGGTARLVDYFAPEPVALARLDGKGESRPDGRFRSRAAAGRAHPRAGPRCCRAEGLRLLRHRARARTRPPRRQAQGLLLGSISAVRAGTFWAINKRAWPGARPQPRAAADRHSRARAELRLRASQLDAAPAPDPHPRPHASRS